LTDVDQEGLDAVSWAAIGGHLHCVELMLDRGCDIDHNDKIKRTPLHLASFYGQEQVVSCEAARIVLDCRLQFYLLPCVGQDLLQCLRRSPTTWRVRVGTACDARKQAKNGN